MYRVRVVHPLVNSQIQHACSVLYDWRKFEPAISGGSLWAWAANRPARDIDIFVKNSRKARKKASSYILNNNGIDLREKIVKHGSYGITWEEIRNIKTIAYTSILPDETPLDIILSPVTGIEAIEYFDYTHCAVAFSPPKTVDLQGSAYYVAGQLNRRHKQARREPVVMSKIQKTLWGNPDAGRELKRIVHELKEIYDNISEGK